MALKAALIVGIAAAAVTVLLAGGPAEPRGTFAHDRSPLGGPTPHPTPRSTAKWRYAPMAWRRLLARRPYVGVSCRRPSSIRCDRIGVAVWLRRATAPVRAAVAGRRLTLRDTGRGGLFVGFLRRAGLADGPLRVPFTARGHWYGEGAPRLRLRVWAGGATTAIRVPLRAGWG